MASRHKDLSAPYAEFGWGFLIGTTLLGINLAAKVIKLLPPGSESAQELFGYSIVYLSAVFALMLLSK